MSKNTPSKNTSLALQLTQVAQVLLCVEESTPGSTALGKIDPNLRAGVQAICFAVWRNWGRARFLSAQLVTKPPEKNLNTLLNIALALLSREYIHKQEAVYDDFTLVNQTVEAAKKIKLKTPQVNFLNACLRRYLREKSHFDNLVTTDLEATWNHPHWWIEKLKADWPNNWQAMLVIANRHAPLTLRVNARKTTPAQYQRLLLTQGIESSLTGADGVLVHQAVPVKKLPRFSDGWVSVQDTAAQLATTLLLEQINSQDTQLRILDACAAPGGKTGHLLEKSQAQIYSLEVDSTRIKRIEENLTRLQLNAQLITGSALTPESWWDGKLFDAILLDAPCSASGVVRRHPDIRWQRTPQDIVQLAAIQAQMLGKLWSLLKIGGILLFCTCSVFKDEGEKQTQDFLRGHNDAKSWPCLGHLLPYDTLTGRAGDDNSLDNDGFYYALFQKITL